MTFADVVIPAHYDTREPFRARYAAAYDDGEAMVDLCADLYVELNDDLLCAMDVPYGWFRADLAHLRELALNLEHTIYAVISLQDAYKYAAANAKAGVA